MKKVFYGGNIITMGNPLYTEAVLIDNGKIIACGSKDEILAANPLCEKIDLKGRTMLPGFIDPHSHFFQVAISLLRVPLGGLSNVEDIKSSINKFISEHKIQPGSWINCRDYDNNIMPGLKNPSMKELDDMAPNYPMVIHFKSGHMGLINSLGMKALGITPESKSPDGGLIEIENGKLTGYLEENAFFDAIKRIPMPEPNQLLHVFEEAQKKYASYGITTVQDGMVVAQMLPLYEMLLKNNSLYLDVFLYSSPEDYSKTLTLLKRYPQNIRLHSGGMKIFLDGSPQGKTAWMRKPYAGEEEYCAYGTMTDENVENAFILAAKVGTQLIAHCNGDAAAAQFLRCLEKAEEKEPILKKLRPVIIHGQLMGKDQIPNAKILGACVSFFVAHVYHWGDVHIRNFGMKRASLISPAGSAVKEGLNVTFHQDSPVIEPDMMETVWCAVNRETKNGVKLSEEERVSPLEALKAITINGAYQYFQEFEKGTIESGKNADFVILNDNPLQVEYSKIRNIKVMATIKNGNVIYKA